VSAAAGSVIFSQQIASVWMMEWKVFDVRAIAASSASPSIFEQR
jgi:hypothetical protein